MCACVCVGEVIRTKDLFLNQLKSGHLSKMFAPTRTEQIFALIMPIHRV